MTKKHTFTRKKYLGALRAWTMRPEYGLGTPSVRKLHLGTLSMCQTPRVLQKYTWALSHAPRAWEMRAITTFYYF